MLRRSRRLGHELPEPGRARRRDGARVEAALHRGEPEQVLGQARLAQGERDALPVQCGAAVALEERRAPRLGAGEEADVTHGAPGDGHAQVGEREAPQGLPLGIVEVLREGAIEALGEVDVERALALREARAAHGRGGRRRRRIEQGRVAEGPVGGVERGAQRGRARPERDGCAEREEADGSKPRARQHRKRLFAQSRAGRHGEVKRRTGAAHFSRRAARAP
jgi:hypothetical protein